MVSMNDRQAEALQRLSKLYARVAHLSADDLAGWTGYLQRRFDLSDRELNEVCDRAQNLRAWADSKVRRLITEAV
jgi:hypothetical protein